VSEPLLLVCRIALLGLVYLTFFRVLRVVWVELRAEQRVPVPGPPPPADRQMVPAGAPPAPPAVPDEAEARLVVLAPPASAGTTFTLPGETTIGRAPGCGVVVDDERVSKLHARVFPGHGCWMVEDLGSTNGTLLNDHALDEATALGPGDRIQVADHVLEFR